MADQQTDAVPRKCTYRSLNPKKLPVLPRHVRLRAWIRQHGRQLVHGWWAWELIAATVSVAATAALVGLLADADQRRQQTWAVGNTQLTFNTIVVAIGTIIRSSLLLVVAGALNQGAWNWFAFTTGGVDAKGRPLKDLETFSEAAANSWNCLKLLWRTKGRYVVSIGALIMILLLPFDAFVQQVLTIEIQPQDVKLSGANLTAGNILPCTLSFSYNDPFNDQSYKLKSKSVVTNGLIKDNTTLPGANCPTGKCSWPVTPTIGICSECTRVNATVTNNSSSTCNYTTYTLPPLSDLPSGSGVENSSLMMTTCSDYNESNWMLDVNDNFSDGNSTIANLYSFGILHTDWAEGFSRPFIAYKCSFYFCVKGYSANSSLGKTNQQQIQTTAHQSHRIIVDDYTGWWVFDDLPPELNAEPTAVFRVDKNSPPELGFLLMEVLSGNASIKSGELPSFGYSSSAASIFWNSSGSLANLTARVQGISDSLTTYIRTAGPVPAPDTRFAPTVEIAVPVVVVRWAWLAYPLVLLFGGLAFLGMTMFATHRRRVRPWKGHRVPLLLAHLDESVRVQAQGGLTHRTGLDDRVGALRVRLEFDGDNGIAFRRVYDRPSL